MVGSPVPGRGRGVTPCPRDQVPCGPTSPGLIRALADANGNVEISVSAKTDYRFRGFLACGGLTLSSNWVDAVGARFEGGTAFSIDAACRSYTFTVLGHYLDGTQAPLPVPHGAVLVCADVFGGGCVGGADSTGTVHMNLNPGVTYSINAFATNMLGWNCPGFVTDTDKLWFSSNLVTGTPDVANGTTFVVYEPNCFGPFNVLDGDGHPFVHAGIWAVPTGGGSMLFGNVDPNGVAGFTNLDPNVEYSFTGFAINTGWGCGYVAPDGTTYHFSAPVQGYPRRSRARRSPSPSRTATSSTRSSITSTEPSAQFPTTRAESSPVQPTTAVASPAASTRTDTPK